MDSVDAPVVEEVRPFRLGDRVRVFPAACAIEVGDQTQRIDFKAMQVLLTLAAPHTTADPSETNPSPGATAHTVTKEILLAQVWPMTAVTDDVLTGAISNLRKALGDDARNPRVIQTVPRVGYRLIAPYCRIDSPTTGDDQATPTGRPTWKVGWLTTGLVLLLGAALGYRTLAPNPVAPPVRSMAVLPLVNLANDRNDRYLAEAMTEALITELARVPDLKIISRTSMARFRDTSRPIPEIGRELGVETVVEGSIQREGNSLRVSAQLIDTATDHHLWADSFDGGMDDVLGLQRSVATAIATHIQAALAPTTDSPLPISADAYESYLRGRYLVARRNQQSLREAVASFQQVNEAEPTFAPAWVALAQAQIVLADERVLPAAEGYPAARHALVRALEHAPANARWFALDATIDHFFEWDFPAAEAAYESAIALDPSDPLARRGYAALLGTLGRFDEAVVQIQRLREVDPLAYSRPDMATLLTSARRLPAALVELDDQIAKEPQNAPLYLQRALVLSYLDRSSESVSSYQKYLTQRGDDGAAVEAVRRAFVQDGLTGVYRLVSAEFEMLVAQGISITYTDRARAFVGAGAIDKALEALERGATQREADILGVAHDPAFDPIRDAHRFRDLLKMLRI